MPKTTSFSVSGQLAPEELAELIAAFPLPDDFEFGVATAGFQNEGGFNGFGEPKNNWADWETGGKVEPSGPAVRFWDDPDEHIRRAASIGIDSFRMSIEWARIFPSSKIGIHSPPQPDDEALEKYAYIVTKLREAGMEPLITLTHFTQPRWLGTDAWSRESTIERYLEFVEFALSGLGSALLAAGQQPIRRLITFNEPNGPGPTGYVIGLFPPGFRGHLGEAYEVTDRMMAAHIRAYNLIHDLYDTRGWPTPKISTNTFFNWTWGLGQFIIDLLLAREAGISDDPSDLRSYVRDSAMRFRAVSTTDPNRPTRSRAILEDAIAMLVPQYVHKRFPRTLEALYTAPRESCLDYISLDYYDPYISNGLMKPGRSTAMQQHWSPIANFWEQRFNPSGIVPACTAAGQNAPQKPVVIAENGMASAVKEGLSYPRPDGITRDVFIRRNLAQIFCARAVGIDLRGYYHWTLVDNYEWGSYTPRFGIYGVDRTGASPKILDTDSLGIDAAGAYRDAIEAVRSAPPDEAAAELMR
jgi:beta-glucosidase